jgi:hypothetical protein
LAEGEVGFLSLKVGPHFFDYPPRVLPPGPSSQFPDSHFEALDGFGCDASLHALRRDEKAKSKERSLVSTPDCAFLCVDFELEFAYDEAANALQHLLPGSLALHMDVAVVGVATEAVSRFSSSLSSSWSMRLESRGESTPSTMLESTNKSWDKISSNTAATGSSTYTCGSKGHPYC